MGYAKTKERIIAVSDLAFDMNKTMFHECAHCLPHADMTSFDTPDALTRDVIEAEAELCGYLVKSVLGDTNNLEYSKDYIQHWLDPGRKEKIRYARVFSAADDILKAGRIAPSPE